VIFLGFVLKFEVFRGLFYLEFGTWASVSDFFAQNCRNLGLQWPPCCPWA